MKKWTAAFLAVFMVIVFAACSSQNKQANSSEAQTQTSSESQIAEKSEDISDNRVLIVYYSYSGVTEGVSERLQGKTGGDVFPLIPTNPYPDDMVEASNRAAEELQSGNLPELTGELPDLSGYDLILVGGPVWSQKAAPPLVKYLSQTDFDGKAVAPFWTYNNNEGAYEEDVNSHIQNADIRDSLCLAYASSMEDSEMDQALDQWLGAIMGSQEISGTQETAVTITVGNQRLQAVLNDSSAAKDFEEMLPLTLSMTRMGEHEYYGSLPQALTHGENLQTGYTVDDLAFWTPGDLFAFYFDEPQDEPEGLMILGRITSDLSVFAQLGNPEEVHIELNTDEVLQ